jgi:hypothetical protein
MTPVPSPELCRRIERMAREDERDGEIGPWSTSEKIAVCLVLNRHDWLTAIGYTMLEACDRINAGGEDWLAACQLVRSMWDEP